jgi:hypothetical protein
MVANLGPSAMMLSYLWHKSSSISTMPNAGVDCCRKRERSGG